MIHPSTELRLINPTVGYGVVATSFIPKGTITWVMDKLDRSFSEKQIANLGAAYQATLKKYCFRDQKGRYILCWDLGRYVNHSFAPNCLTTAYDFELAVRDIEKGEQLTNHYGYLNLEPMYLLSDDGLSEQLVSPQDLLKHAQEWDVQLHDAFQSVQAVPQVLENYLTDHMRKKIEAITSQKKKIDSIAKCYFDSSQSKTRRRHG